MQDRVPLYPGRVTLTPVSGQANTYDLTRADQPTQEGTPLNKASLLKDATAALFGLGADAVPDDVLHLLSRFQSGLGNEYVWAKSGLSEGQYTLGAKTELVLTYGAQTSSLYPVVYVADSVIVSAETGTVTLNAPKETTISSDSTIKRKYVQSMDDGTGEESFSGIWYIPLDASYSWAYATSPSSGYKATVDKAQKVTGHAGTTTTTYLNSPSPDAYPPAVDDGYTYTLLGQLGDKVRIATGSYTGTGTYGSSNPNSLTFEFEPTAIFMWMSFSSSSTDIRFYDSLVTTTCIAAIPANDVYYSGGFDNPSQTRGKIKRSIDGKTITWYSTDSGYQKNISGNLYYFVAIA